MSVSCLPLSVCCPEFCGLHAGAFRVAADRGVGLIVRSHVRQHRAGGAGFRSGGGGREPGPYRAVWHRGLCLFLHRAWAGNRLRHLRGNPEALLACRCIGPVRLCGLLFSVSGPGGLWAAVRLARFRRLPARTRSVLRSQHAGQSVRVFPGDDRRGAHPPAPGFAGSAQERWWLGGADFPHRAGAFLFARIAGERGGGSGRAGLAQPAALPPARAWRRFWSAGGAAAAFLVSARISRLCGGLLAAPRRVGRIFLFQATTSVRARASWLTLAAWIESHPWQTLFGIGYKTLPYTDYLGAPIVADNMYLSLLVETGIAGLAALVWLNVAILRAAARAARDSHRLRAFCGTWMLCFWAGRAVQMLPPATADLLARPAGVSVGAGARRADMRLLTARSVQRAGRRAAPVLSVLEAMSRAGWPCAGRAARRRRVSSRGSVSSASKPARIACGPFRSGRKSRVGCSAGFCGKPPRLAAPNPSASRGACQSRRSFTSTDHASCSPPRRWPTGRSSSFHAHSYMPRRAVFAT